MYEAALLTRCYTQHALLPFINAEINHQRHFIKIPFINKGMDFIDLPSIFQDKSVTSSIPDYFQNSEPPIICYMYTAANSELVTLHFYASSKSKSRSYKILPSINKPRLYQDSASYFIQK